MVAGAAGGGDTGHFLSLPRNLRLSQTQTSLYTPAATTRPQQSSKIKPVGFFVFMSFISFTHDTSSEGVVLGVKKIFLDDGHSFDYIII